MAFYLEQGFPAPAVQYYLRGLANGRLGEVPLAEALAQPIRLSECGTAGPLIDMAKLDDICANHVATLPGELILALVTEWAAGYDPDLVPILEAHHPLALQALAIERDDDPNPRKDLRKWAEFRAVYGSFRRAVRPGHRPRRRPLRRPGPGPGPGRGPRHRRRVRRRLPAACPGHRVVRPDPQPGPRPRLRPSQKVYKKDPAAYHGSIREISQVVRILLTGTPRSPDLPLVAATLGTQEVLRRIRAVL